MYNKNVLHCLNLKRNACTRDFSWIENNKIQKHKDKQNKTKQWLQNAAHNTTLGFT